MLNLSILLEDSARKHPNRDALVLGEIRLTYPQVDAAANQVANLLVERGVQPGDKVALSSPNLPWFPIVYYGALKAGAVVVPLNILLKAREVAYHLTDADVVAYFCRSDEEEVRRVRLGETGMALGPRIRRPSARSPTWKPWAKPWPGSRPRSSR